MSKTCSLDSKLVKWDFLSEKSEKVASKLFSKQSKKGDQGVRLVICDLQLAPGTEALNAASNKKDFFAAAGADGNIYLCSKGATRVESAIEAHTGAVLCLSWNSDSNLLASGGEDGQLKIWSRSGIFRHLLLKQDHPVLSLSWSSDNQTLAAASDRYIIIKSTAPGQQFATQWRAHEGSVTQVDWSAIVDKVASVGADHRYKLWTPRGDLLYSSSVHDHPLTSLSWSPDGRVFAVGSFNYVKVCDEQGWAHTASRPEVGSVYSMKWSHDGTQLAFAGANGAVLLGHLTGARYVWDKYNVFLTKEKQLTVFEDQPRCKLELPDRPTALKLAHNHMLVATPSQLLIYSCDSWQSPIVCDVPLGSSTILLVIAREEFLLVNSVLGAAVYSFTGQVLANLNIPQFSNRVENYPSPSLISLGSGIVALADRSVPGSVIIADSKSGKVVNSLKYPRPNAVASVLVSQVTTSLGVPLVAVLDKEQELWVSPSDHDDWKRVAMMVTCAMWHENCNFLAYVADDQLQVNFCPTLYFVDDELVPMAQLSKSDSRTSQSGLWKQQIIYFTGSQAMVRNSDGSLAAVNCSADLLILLENAISRRLWEKALKLCRFAKSNILWSMLAGEAIVAGELGSAEVAYAQLRLTTKVIQICHINSLASDQEKAAELALLCRKTLEAETILLNAQLYEQAVHLNIDLQNWTRALDLALRYGLDTSDLVSARVDFLRAANLEETDARYKNELLKYSRSVRDVVTRNGHSDEREDASHALNGSVDSFFDN